MFKAYILRRDNLGYDSAEGIKKYSKTGIDWYNKDKEVLPQDPDMLCIRWGCTSNVPQKKVLNKAKAIHAVCDKAGFRRVLYEAKLGLPMEQHYEDACNLREEFGSIVIRPHTHQEGLDFYRCKNLEQIGEAIDTCGPDWYAAPFIEKSAEYRINVLQGRVLCVVSKSPKNKKDLVWQGNVEIPFWSEWDLDAVSHACKALVLSGLDFAGVDVIVDKEGNPYVLELNSAPWLEYQYQPKTFAKGLDYICKTGNKDTIPVGKKRHWQSYIHPALLENE